VAYRVLVRTGPRVERLKADRLSDALDLLEQRCRALARRPTGEPVQIFRRTIEPVARVMARVEISGPQRLRPAVRGGVDLRGDGSVEAWTGRVPRAVIAQADGESPYEALRRALSSASSGP
jgi:hypothetical protein